MCIADKPIVETKSATNLGIVSTKPVCCDAIFITHLFSKAEFGIGLPPFENFTLECSLIVANSLFLFYFVTCRFITSFFPSFEGISDLYCNVVQYTAY